MAETDEKLSSIDGLSINAGTGFFFAPVLIDEISYDTDPESYRPNVIQKIQCGGDEREVELRKGEKLKIDLQLALKGTRAPSGQLSLRLLNGMEKQVLKKDLAISWKTLKGDNLEIELPAPSRSGYYWLEASYKEKGWKIADIARTRVDIQFISSGFDNPENSRYTIRTPWDFIPVDDEKPHSFSRKSSAPPPVPETVPSDWEKSIPLNGPWRCWAGEMFRTYSTGYGAWYRQKLAIPKSWKGRRILLDIDDPRTVAYVFVDGKRIGEIENPGGQVDITAEVTPGRVADVALFVVATNFFGKVKITKDILGKRYQIPSWGARLKVRGLVGDVSLVSEPKGARVDSVVVRTYVKDKKLWLGFNCANLAPGKKYKIESEVTAAGETAKKVPPISFTASSSAQEVSVEVPWSNPRLWDIGHPYLYDLNAKLIAEDGKTIDTIYPVRFGFREIRFEGRIVTLNGNPITFLAPLSSGYSINNFGYRGFMTKLGLNGVHKIRTIAARNAKFFDEAGIGLRYKAGDGFFQFYLPVLAKYGKEKDPRFWKVYQRDIEYEVRRSINNPSVMFWRGEKFSNKTGLEMNPLLQDGVWTKNATSDQEERMMEVAKRTNNIIKRLDPTRFQSALCSHNFNDTIDTNYYTGFNPIQELIERNEYWIKYGTKPYFMDEFASPYQTDWCNSPWEGGGGHRSPRKVPQIAEWLSVTNGDKAFIRGDLAEKALKMFEKQSISDLEKATKIKDPRKRKIAIGKKAIKGFKKVCALYTFNYGNSRDKLVEKRIREQIFNWRADDVGMMCYFGGGQLRDLSMSKYYQPVVAFIAGTPEKRTAKDHIFAPGETLRRSVIILNNARKTVVVKCEWKLTLDGKMIKTGGKTVSVAPGGQERLFINARIPAGGDRAGTLSMNLYAEKNIRSGVLNFTKNQKICGESIPINILAPLKRILNAKVAVIDPEGDTSKELEKTEVKFEKIHFNSDLTKYDLIIFGRRAFDYEAKILGSGLDLGVLTRRGKNIIIMEQSEKTLRERFNFRTEYTAARNVFARYGAGVLFKGLPEACLKYWRGAATLTDGYEVARETLQPAPGFRDGAWYPYVGNDGKVKNRIVKWGNTHNVVTVMIIKPDVGNFRTLVECGFSLNYAGALELLNANGRVIFNQLDVSGRTEKEPAARRFLGNLVKYAESAPKPKWRNAAYLGGEKGADLLSFLRIDSKRLASPEEAKPDDVLILGEVDSAKLADWGAEIAKFVESGGTLFSLPKKSDFFKSTFLPFKIETSNAKVNFSVIGKDAGGLLAGLGNFDFYWKGDIDIVALKKVEGADLNLTSGVLASVPRGKGKYLFCQIAPWMFDVNKRFWLKQSKYRDERLIIRMLSNLGVQMKTPSFMKAVGSKIRLASTIPLSGPWKVVKGKSDDLKAPAGNGAKWSAVNLPGDFQKQIPVMAERKGFVWFKRSFKINGELENAKFAELEIGQISGCDRTYINGEIVGESNMNTHVNDVGVAFRQYKIPLKLFRKGDNVIAIRVEFNVDALLGMRGTTGAISPPLELKIYAENKDQAANAHPINLEGKWKGIAIGNKEKPRPPKNDANWHDLMVPGAYEKQNTKWEAYDGFFWYKRTFKLKEKPNSNAEPFLLMGGVDDWDTTYINGKEIGHTTPQNFFKMSSAYNTPRKYPVPTALLKKGINEISLMVEDPHFDGGITLGPVKLVFSDPKKVARYALSRGNYLQLASDYPDCYVARHW